MTVNTIVEIENVVEVVVLDVKLCAFQKKKFDLSFVPVKQFRNAIFLSYAVCLCIIDICNIESLEEKLFSELASG